MPLKRTDTEGAPRSAATTHDPATSDSPAFRENAEVNAKIDAYIKNNPKEWEYIRSMPRTRMERSLVLQAIQKLERREKLRASVLKKLDENPELKAAYRTLIKDLPAEKQDAALLQLAMRTRRTIAPPEPKQGQTPKV